MFNSILSCPAWDNKKVYTSTVQGKKTYTGIPGILGFHPVTVVAHLVVDDVLDDEGLLEDCRCVGNLALNSQLHLKQQEISSSRAKRKKTVNLK